MKFSVLFAVGANFVRPRAFTERPYEDDFLSVGKTCFMEGTPFERLSAFLSFTFFKRSCQSTRLFKYDLVDDFCNLGKQALVQIHKRHRMHVFPHKGGKPGQRNGIPAIGQ